MAIQVCSGHSASVALTWATGRRCWGGGCCLHVSMTMQTSDVCCMTILGCKQADLVVCTDHARPVRPTVGMECGGQGTMAERVLGLLWALTFAPGAPAEVATSRVLSESLHHYSNVTTNGAELAWDYVKRCIGQARAPSDAGSGRSLPGSPPRGTAVSVSPGAHPANVNERSAGKCRATWFLS